MLEITPQQRNENGSLLRAISSSFRVPFLDMVISASDGIMMSMRCSKGRLMLESIFVSVKPTDTPSKRSLSRKW